MDSREEMLPLPLHLCVSIFFSHFCCPQIRALSHVLKVPITVYQAESAPLVIGEEYNDLLASLTLSLVVDFFVS